MPTLVSNCPRTGDEVSLGIEVDLNSFSLLPDIPVRFRCSSCHRDHIQLLGNGRLRRGALEEVSEAIAVACWRG